MSRWIVLHAVPDPLPLLEPPVAEGQRWKHEEVEHHGGQEPPESDDRHGPLDLAARRVAPQREVKKPESGDERSHEDRHEAAAGALQSRPRVMRRTLRR